MCSYRDREEVKQVRNDRDCIKQLEAYIIEGELATEEELKAVAKGAKEEVEEAIVSCQTGEELAPSEVYSDVVVGQGDLFVRGPDPFTNSHAPAASAV